MPKKAVEKWSPACQRVSEAHELALVAAEDPALLNKLKN
jgi:hypothetical protein